MDRRRKKHILLKIKTILQVLFLLCLAGIVSFTFLILYYIKDLPRPEKFTERRISQPTKIYDREGETLLYTIFEEEKREIISLDEIPEHLKQAVITAEDKNFYNHFGIDLRRMISAFLVNLELKRPAQGASTISQQLIRSTFLTPKKTIERKIREIVLSIELDRRYSKDQILEWYFNQVPFGSNCYGIEASSQTFFSKETKDLSLAEAATLSSLIQAPSYLSPYGEHKDELLERKNYILDQMAKQGYISKEAAIEAKKQELNFATPTAPIVAPQFVLYVKKYLLEKYGKEYLKTKGLKVYTSLDIELQKLAEETIKKGVEKNQSLQAYNAALVAADPKTGEVLALVGNKDYFADSYPPNCTPGDDCLFEPEFNVATLGKRQPGSSFKPFVYAAAFEKGYNDQYIVVDEETNFGVWGGKPYIPHNYDGLFRGPVTLRQALAQSLNVPAVKVLVYLAGIENSIKTARELGITTLKEPSFYGPSLVLGGGEVTLFDMVSAFGVFANKGLRNSPVTILKIEDSQGKIIEKSEIRPKRVLKSSTAELITSILSDNKARASMFGPNSVLYVSDNVAVKTGTTQYYNDAWTVGYNENIVVGVWVGNNDNSSTYSLPGVALAGPIWNSFITETINRTKLTSFKSVE